MPGTQEPAAKKARTDLNQGPLKESLEAIADIQSEIDRVNEKSSEEIINVEQKFNKLRKPVFSKRQALVQNISNFWLTAMLNHPGIANIISQSDAELLQYLKNLCIEEHEDIKSGYKVLLEFDENPYFDNKKLEKDNGVTEDGDSESTWTEIKWKTEHIDFNKNFNTNTPSDEQPDSFFSWFQKETDPEIDDLGDMIKDDLWPNPLQYYEADDDDDEEEFEEGGCCERC